MFVIFRCSCGQHLYALKGSKTRTCPCKKRIYISRAKILAEASDAIAAGDIVRKLQLGKHEMCGFSPAKL
jgi:hypothetical protein